MRIKITKRSFWPLPWPVISFTIASTLVIWLFKVQAGWHQLEGIDIDLSFQGIGKALFSSEGVFWIKCSGQGDIFLNSFGAIYEIEVDGGYVVDTGHIVAFEDSLEFNIGKSSSGWISSFYEWRRLGCKVPWARQGLLSNPQPTKLRFDPRTHG